MTALGVAAWRPTPGQFTSFFGNVVQGKALHERHGLTVSVWNAVYAGANSMSVLYVTNAADLATYTRQTSETVADPDWMAFWGGVVDAVPASATLLSNSLSVTVPEIASDPVGVNTSGTPRAVETFNWGPLAPPQRAALVELVGGVLTARVHDRGGSINLRMSVVGGPAGPGLALSIMSPSIEAWGTSRQESSGDPALVAAVQKAASVTGPPMSNTLLAEVLL